MQSWQSMQQSGTKVAEASKASALLAFEEGQQKQAAKCCKVAFMVIGGLTGGYDSASDAGTEDSYSYYVADGLHLKPPHIDINKFSNNNYKFSLKKHCRHHRSSATHLDAAQIEAILQSSLQYSTVTKCQ
jgi:hypothetical protein